MKPSGGSTQFGFLPGNLMIGTIANPLTANVLRYIPVLIPYAITLTAWQFEVTSGPASNANLRHGLYIADADWQPSGGPLYDSGAISIASGFTGVKSASGLSISVARGRYLLATNVDVAMSLRFVIIPGSMVKTGVSASPQVLALQKSSVTFAALANPGTLWDTINGGTTGPQACIFYQWTE
jgi:hypothetical protein